MNWFRRKEKEVVVPPPSVKTVAPIAPQKRAIATIAQPGKSGWIVKADNFTNGLRSFNIWRDDFLIELSTLMLMVGFIIGTVDVFTSGKLYSVPAFNIAWAIIQAIAIDGLFFAVWGKIRRATWTWKSWFPNVMLIIVGLLLAIVATLVNGLLSYQELTKVDSIASAMSKMTIDQSTFTYARSILVVLVSILVALFTREDTSDQQKLSLKDADIAQLEDIVDGYEQARKEQDSQIAKQNEVIDSLNQQLQEATAQTSIAKRSPRKSYSPTTLTEVTDQDSQAIAPRPSISGYASTESVDQDSQAIATPIPESVDQDSQAMTTQPGYGIAQDESQSGYGEKSIAQQNGYIAKDDGQTLSIADSHGQTVMATGSFRDRIKEVMLQAIAKNETIDYGQISQMTGASYGTVKKWAPKIREELEEEPTTEKLETVESSTR